MDAGLDAPSHTCCGQQPVFLTDWRAFSRNVTLVAIRAVCRRFGIRTIGCPNRRILLKNRAAWRVRLALRQQRDQLRRIVVVAAIHVAIRVTRNVLSLVSPRLYRASPCSENEA